MSQFKYTLPSGAKFTMEAPAGTTQDQADYIFYSQVAAGALVGFVPGQSISSTSSSLAKFTLSRLDRRTAGVDDTVILAIVNGLPTVNNLASVDGFPTLINTPLENPITQANIAAIASTGFTAPAIGALSNTQVQALMAQVVNTVNQPATTATDVQGIGQYGFSCQQLEMAGYVKPGTWQQFIKSGPSTLTEVLNAPGIWTGLNGIYTLADFLNSTFAQNDSQATLMQNGYDSLKAAGVITTPGAQNISAVVGEVYTGSNVALTTATTTVTNTVNGQVAALITNSSQYGTELTAQWAQGLPPVTNLTSNLTGITAQSIPGISSLGALAAGITPTLATVQTAMNVLGKASQFAATAASNLSNISLSGIGDKLSNINVTGLADKVGASATALAGQIQGQLTGQANALLGQAPAQAGALLAQAQSQVNSLIAQGQGLVAGVEKAAGFANTVNRASVDVAFTKILGSSKIPVPNFGTADSASIGAALDISKAQGVLQNLQGQGTALVAQAKGVTNGLPVFNASQINKIL
jgi:hypothetical protein